MKLNWPSALVSSCLLSLLGTMLLISSSSATVSDGVLEINQSCVATGCFPGDAAGYPVTITTSGSYRLTSSLSQTITGFGGDGINTESFFGSGSLVESSVARNNSGDGIRVGFNALVRGSVATGNTNFSIAGGSPILGGPSGSGYTECIADGPTEQITNLGSNL